MLKLIQAYISKKPLMIVSLIFLLTILLINNSTTMIKMAYPTKYKGLVITYSEKYSIDPNLVYAIIKAESGFTENAVSRKNAMGLMQITKPTGTWGAKVLKIEDFTTNYLFKPDINIMIGCWYLNELMKEFDNDLQLVIVAYNAGSGNVRQWLADKRYCINGKNLVSIPFEETERYVRKVNEYYEVYTRLYGTN